MSKQIFEDAVERELLARNPLAGLHGAVGGNRERDFFGPRYDRQGPGRLPRLPMAAIICPGPLRTPALPKRNPGSNLERRELGRRANDRSSKTEYHEGKAFRVVPLFSELRPFLNAVWDEAEENAQFVITRYRAANANLRMQLTKVIAQAGRRRMAETISKSSRSPGN
jgi:hypothetical protein